MRSLNTEENRGVFFASRNYSTSGLALNLKR